MEPDARRMNTAHHLRCRAVFMRQASHSIRCSREKPISRYVFIWHLCSYFHPYTGSQSRPMHTLKLPHSHVLRPGALTRNKVQHTAVLQLLCDFAYAKGLIQVRATSFILVYLYAVPLFLTKVSYW